MCATTEVLRNVPMTPILPTGVSFGRASSVRSVLDVQNSLFVSSGTAAIHLALQKVSSGFDNQVLLPAYLCESVIEAVTETGMIPTYYKINPDTTADLDDISSRITEKTKVFLVVHLFGKLQDMPAIRSFCDRYGLTLIEDCAHAFFGSVDGAPVGYYSDYVIASLPKFFPVYEGGVLASVRHSLDTIKLDPRSIYGELRGLFNAFELTDKYKRSRLIDLSMALPKRLRAALKARSDHTTNKAMQWDSGQHGADPPYVYFTRDNIKSRASLYSIAASRFGDLDAQILMRRYNYAYLHERLKHHPNAQPLFATTSKTFVPYVCPLLIHDAEQVRALREEGLPFWMWEHIHSSVCETSTRYARSLIQLPCHQSLHKKDLDLIIDCINRVCQ
jgi:perosamine synthetase